MHPSTFGPDLHDKVKEKLRDEVEGTVDGQYGFIITITSIDPIPLGQIDENGFAKFALSYKAIVFRPVVNEVIDAVVTKVDKMGLFCNAGPLNIFVHNDQMPSDMCYDQQAGAFVCRDEGIEIKERTEIRLRIKGFRFDVDKIFAVGTIKGDYLGVIS